MKRQRLPRDISIFLLLPALFAGIASAAFLTSDYPWDEKKETRSERPPRVDPPEPRPPIIRPRPRPIPAPIPQAGNAASRLLREVQIGSPYRYQHLVIYPLNLAGGGEHSGLRTLDEALRRGWVVIEERDRATVSKIEIRNRSDHSVFVMAGEIIGGGKQNRVVQHDLILPPRSGTVTMPVYCIEEDRWGSSKGEFRSQANLAHPALRKRSAERAPQASIWAEVDARSSAAGVVARTKNYEALYADRAVQDKLAACLPPFRRFCGSRTVGAVAVVGHRIVGADLFSDPALFSSLWDKILRSYALDYISYPHPMPRVRFEDSRRRYIVPHPDVRGFLRNAASANYSRRSTPGSGTLYRICGRAEGETLIWGGSAAHIGLFGNLPAVRPAPHPVPLPGPHPRFRDR